MSHDPNSTIITIMRWTDHLRVTNSQPLSNVNNRYEWQSKN